MSAPDCHRLRDCIAPEQHLAAETALLSAEADAHLSRDPLLLRLLLGLGAWFAGLLLTIGITIPLALTTLKSALFIGLVAMLVAIFVERALPRPGIFLSQLILTVMMCGLALAWIGIMEICGGLRSSADALLLGASILTVLALATAPFFRRASYQMVSLCLCVCLWVGYALETENLFYYHLLIASQAILLAIITTRITHRNAFAYALTFSLGTSIFLLDLIRCDLGPRFPDTPLWPANLSITVLAAFIAFRLIPKSSRNHANILVFCGITLLLTFFSTPGLLFSIIILALGYALRDRIYLAIGFIALPTFLILFYYTLQISLLAKSGILLASGLICMLIAALIRPHTTTTKEAMP